MAAINNKSLLANYLWHERTDVQRAAVLLVACAIIFSLTSLAVLPTGTDLLRFKQFAHWCSTDSLGAGLILSTSPILLAAMIGGWFCYSTRENPQHCSIYKTLWKERTNAQRAFVSLIAISLITLIVLGMTHQLQKPFEIISTVGSAAYYGLSLIGLSLMFALVSYIAKSKKRLEEVKNETPQIQERILSDDSTRIISEIRDYESAREFLDREGIPCEKLDNLDFTPRLGLGDFGDVFDVNGKALKVYQRPKSFEDILKMARKLKSIPQGTQLPKFLGVAYIKSLNSWALYIEKVDVKSELRKMVWISLELVDVYKGMLDLIPQLKALESIQLAHGDVSPQNVLLRRDGTWVMIDFDENSISNADSINLYRRLFQSILLLLDSNMDSRYKAESNTWDFSEKREFSQILEKRAAQIPPAIIQAFILDKNSTWDKLEKALRGGLS